MDRCGPVFNLDGLEDKWRDDSPDYPPCAECGRQIGSEEDEDREELEEPEVPFRLWRDHPAPARAEAGEKQELAFHQHCASKRMRIG